MRRRRRRRKSETPFENSTSNKVRSAHRQLTQHTRSKGVATAAAAAAY